MRMRALSALGAVMLALAPLLAQAQPPAARVEAGRKLFQRCVGCHAVGPGAGNVYGPQLNGIVGRKAGGLPGYGYSAAMRAAPLTWNERNLAAFIRDADQVVPGNKMRFMNFLSAQQAADIVAYLATQPATSQPGQPVTPR